MRKTLFMETTGISPQRTSGEIIALLVSVGASQVNQEFKDSRIVGLRWIMLVRGTPTLFSMPIRSSAVFKVINGRRVRPRRGSEEEDRRAAERIAWRQLLRWVEAQTAMIETGLAEAGEVFLPYAEFQGRTLFEHMVDRGMKLLPAPVRNGG
jgi:hypothetical protein